MLQKITQNRVVQIVTQNRISLDGQLDGNNGRWLLEHAKKLHKSGAQDIVIDMKGVRSVSENGVEILSQIDQLFAGNPKKNVVRYKRHGPDNKGRLKRVKRRAIINLKLLNLDPRAEAAISEGGFTQFIALYGDA